MQKLKEIVYVPIKQVIRDEHQPRQYFNANRIADLAASIKKLGIKEPLTVEALPDGTYKLVDGERRWRAAQTIGIKEVPVLIEKALSPSDRVIEQFHLQEMHEGWRPDEKAIAIDSLAKTLNVNFAEAAKMVGVNVKVAQGYQALMSLRERASFLASNLPIDRASNIRNTITTAKTQVRRQLETEFDEDEQKQMERLLITKLVDGELKTGEDFRTLHDAFIKDANNVVKFMKGASASHLFKTSDAAGVRAYRKLKTAMVNVDTYLRTIAKSKDALILMDEDKRLKTLIRGNVKNLSNFV